MTEARAKLNEYYRGVGRRVTEAMEKAGVVDAELAVLCGVQTKHIVLLKCGTPGYVHGKIVGLVAQALSVKVEWLYPNIDET